MQCWPCWPFQRQEELSDALDATVGHSASLCPALGSDTWTLKNTDHWQEDNCTHEYKIKNNNNGRMCWSFMVLPGTRHRVVLCISYVMSSWWHFCERGSLLSSACGMKVPGLVKCGKVLPPGNVWNRNFVIAIINKWKALQTVACFFLSAKLSVFLLSCHPTCLQKGQLISLPSQAVD